MNPRNFGATYNVKFLKSRKIGTSNSFLGLVWLPLPLNHFLAISATREQKRDRHLEARSQSRFCPDDDN